MPDKPDHRLIHQRAGAVLLDLVAEQPANLPGLEAIAERLGEPLTILSSFYADTQQLISFLARESVATLVDTCVKAIVKVDPERPLDQFLALGRAYLEWALAHPRHFRLMTDRRYIDISHEEDVQRHVVSMRVLMRQMLVRAADRGDLPKDADFDLIILSGRSFAYGLARMVIDDRLREFYPDAVGPEIVLKAMDQYVETFALAVGATTRQPSHAGT